MPRPTAVPGYPRPSELRRRESRRRRAAGRLSSGCPWCVLDAQAGEQSVYVLLAADGAAIVDPRNGRAEAAPCLIRNASRAARAGLREAYEVSERDLQLADELHYAADDLTRKILVLLRDEHLREVPAHLVHVGRSCVQERVHVAHHALEVLDRDLALAEQLPDFDEVTGAARRALGQRTRLLHEIERAMSCFVRQPQHVIEAQPCIRNVFLGEIDQARVDAKALQRRLQIAG